MDKHGSNLKRLHLNLQHFANLGACHLREIDRKKPPGVRDPSLCNTRCRGCDANGSKRLVKSGSDSSTWEDLWPKLDPHPAKKYCKRNAKETFSRSDWKVDFHHYVFTCLCVCVLESSHRSKWHLHPPRDTWDIDPNSKQVLLTDT